LWLVLWSPARWEASGGPVLCIDIEEHGGDKKNQSNEQFGPLVWLNLFKYASALLF
jgi:hypothetical protein